MIGYLNAATVSLHLRLILEFLGVPIQWPADLVNVEAIRIRIGEPHTDWLNRYFEAGPEWRIQSRSFT